MANIIVSKLDADQIVRLTYDEAANAVKTLAAGGTLVPDEYDEIDLTYVAAGPGVGSIETATYSFEGDVICTLTLSYDGVDRLIKVKRT